MKKVRFPGAKRIDAFLTALAFTSFGCTTLIFYVSIVFASKSNLILPANDSQIA